MATIDKHGALHDRTGKYSGSVRGGVSTDVKPTTAIEWKKALFSDFSPPETSSVKNPEATAAAKQAIFLAPHPIKSSEGNTVKLKNVLKGIGVGAAIIGVTAGCAGGNASSAEPAQTPDTTTTATVEATPDDETTDAPTEATPAPEAPSGPQPGEVGYVISAKDVEAGQVNIKSMMLTRTVGEGKYERDVYSTKDGNALYLASDGSAVIIDPSHPLPGNVLDNLTEFSNKLDNSSEKQMRAFASLNDAGVQGVFLIRYRVMDSNGSIHDQFAPYAMVESDVAPDDPASIDMCIWNATWKTARDGSDEQIILDHDEAIALAQKCAKLKPGIPIYDVTGLVPPTQLQ